MSIYDFKPSPYSSHTLLLAQMPADGEGRSVLDVGCGDGHIAALLARRGFFVTGVERPGGFTEKFPPEVELHVADLDAGINNLTGSFDYILCADILEHLKQPSVLLRSLHRLLAPDGVLIASLPNSGNIYFRLNVLAGRFPQHDKGLFDRTHLHFYMWNGWRDLFHEAGFRILTVKPTGIPVGLALPRAAETLLIRAAEWASYQAARAWRKLFAYQFLITARPEISNNGA